MTSPPTWADLTVPIPTTQLERNYRFWTSPVVNNWAFALLEQKWSIQLFSNWFLFDKERPCDEIWLDNVINEVDPKGRIPVQAFNAGLCMHRSYQQELTNFTQPTLIIQSQQDSRRNQQRELYQTLMKQCEIITLSSGRNVLPWEVAPDVRQAVHDFLVRKIKSSP
jgi:hypothetical protein